LGPDLRELRKDVNNKRHQTVSSIYQDDVPAIESHMMTAVECSSKSFAAEDENMQFPSQSNNLDCHNTNIVLNVLPVQPESSQASCIKQYQEEPQDQPNAVKAWEQKRHHDKFDSVRTLTPYLPNSTNKSSRDQVVKKILLLEPIL